MDLYVVNESHKNKMWVRGPNQHFVKSMETILGCEFWHYDAVLVFCLGKGRFTSEPVLDRFTT